jgi:hypothetical protein
MEHAARFEEDMERIMNDPVYKDRFSINIVYAGNGEDE